MLNCKRLPYVVYVAINFKAITGLRYESILNFFKCHKKVFKYKNCGKYMSLYQTFVSATKKYATTKIVAEI